MDPLYAMDYSDAKTSWRKIAKSPALSNITEEKSGTSLSDELSSPPPMPSSNRKRSLQAQACTLTPKRKLFSPFTHNMDVDLENSDCFDSTPPAEDQSEPQQGTPSKEKRSGTVLAEGSSTNKKICLAPKKPLQIRNQADHSRKRFLKTEPIRESINPPDNANDIFDKLFVCGIFNTVKPVAPTLEDLQTVYINESSEDDYVPTPKMCKKVAPQSKKKRVQLKLTEDKKSPSTSPSDDDFDFS